MKKKITAKKFELTDRIKEKADEQMEGLSKFFENITSAEFVFDTEKHRHLAELRLNVSREQITAHAEGYDMFTAMQEAVDKAKTQLKKHKGKLQLKKPEKVLRVSEQLTRPMTNDDEVDV